jgi:uncharacterized pyridoxamine 5'-phosphate oxidase family protein
MDIQDCIKFANANSICSLATVENDQPRVRILGFWFADGKAKGRPGKITVTALP